MWKTREDQWSGNLQVARRKQEKRSSCSENRTRQRKGKVSTEFGPGFMYSYYQVQVGSTLSPPTSHFTCQREDRRPFLRVETSKSSRHGGRVTSPVSKRRVGEGRGRSSSGSSSGSGNFGGAMGQLSRGSSWNVMGRGQSESRGGTYRGAAGNPDFGGCHKVLLPTYWYWYWPRLDRGNGGSKLRS